MRFLIVLSLILACFTRTSSQTGIQGSTRVCEFECHTYTFDGFSPAFWMVTGGLVEENQGSEIEVCWEEAQMASIVITSGDQNPNNADVVLDVRVEPEPDPSISFPIFPSCQDSVENDFKQEFEEADNCIKVCGGDVAFYGAVGSIGNRFEWEVLGAVSVAELGDDIEVLWPEEGFGSISLTETTPNGCVETKLFCVEILNRPTLEIIHTNPQINLSSVCQNQNINLEAFSNEAGDFYWLSSDGQTAEGNLASFAFDSEGSYTVQLVASTECRCEVETEITINVIDTTSSIIECVGTICPGTEATYYAGDICGSYDWQISGNGIIVEGGTSTDNYLTVNWGSGPSGTISLSTSGCDDVNICTQASVAFIPIIDATTGINGPNEVCSDDQSSYYAPSYEGTNYNWAITGNGSIIKGQGTNQITVQWASTVLSGIDNAQIEVNMDNCFLGCDSQGEINVSIKDNFSLTAEPSYCENTTAYFGAFSGYNSAQVDWYIITPDENVIDIGQDLGFTSVDLNYGPGYYEMYASENNGTFCNQEFRTGFMVEASPEPVTDILGPEFVCIGQAYTYSVISQGDQFNYDWIISDGGTITTLQGKEIFVQWTSTGPYQLEVKVTDTETGCSSTEFTKTLQETSGNTIFGDNIVCLDAFSSYNLLNAEGVEVDWIITPDDAGTIASANENEVTIQWHQGGVQNLQADFCGNSIDINITVTNFAYSVVNPDALCEGEEGEIIVSPPTNGRFRVVNELGAFMGDTNPVLVGPGYYGIEVFDNNGCRQYKSLYIDSYPTPPINISSRELGNLCLPNGQALMEALVTTEGLDYSWTFDGSPIGGNNPTLTIDRGGELSLQVTDVNGCTAEYTLVAECVDSRCECRPDGGVSFSAAPGILCNEFTFTNTSIAFIPGTLTYFFNDPESGVISTTDENPSHTFSKAGHFPVVLRGTVPSATDPNETCAASFVQIITVEAAADFDYIPGCDDIQFFDNSSFIPEYTAPIAYNWEFGDGDFSAFKDPVYNYSSPGIYEVTHSIFGGANTLCDAEIKKEITVHDGPIIDFNYSNITCTDEAIYFSGEGDAPLFAWDFDDSPNQFSLSQEAVHNFETAGFYDVALLGENIYGCQTEVVKTIEVFDNNLSGEITMDQTMPLCDGETVNLDAPTNGVAYLWSTGETTETINTGTPGLYKVTVTSADGCEYTPQSVVVNIIRPINPIITAAEFDGGFNPQYKLKELEICEGDAFVMNASYSQSASQYEWSNGETGRFLDPNQTVGLAAGEYEYIVTVTHTDTGCEIASEPFLVVIHPSPAAFSIVSDQTDFCEGSEFTFSINNPDSNLRYFWNNGIEGASLTTSAPGTYYATAVTEFGCTRNSNNLTIYPLPDIERMLTGCQEVCFPETLCVAVSPNNTNFQWFLDGVAIPGANGSELEASEVGEYQVLLENQFGCSLLSDVLSLTPETKEQKLSGVVFKDTNGNDIYDVGEELLQGVPVNITSGNTVIQSTVTDANGFYEFDPLESSEAIVAIDPVSLGIDVGTSTLFYEFELKSCTEVLEQDFPLITECVGGTFNLTLFTCPGEPVEYENEFYDAFETAEVIVTDENGCESTINLDIQEYSQALYIISTDNTCAGMDNGALFIGADYNSGLEFSINGGTNFTSDLAILDLAAGPYTLIISDINGCLRTQDFEIFETPIPDTSFELQESCEQEATGAIIITNNSGSNLEFAVDDPTNVTQLTVINSLSEGSHILFIMDDSGCTFEQPFNIDAMAAPQVNIIPTETCPEEAMGSIEIDVPASANFQYAIDDPSNITNNTTIEDLEEGEHILFVVDDNGCTSSQIFFIEAYPIPELDVQEFGACADQVNGMINIITEVDGLMYSMTGADFSDALEFTDIEVGDHILYIQTPENCVFEYDFNIEESSKFNFEIINQVNTCEGNENGEIQFDGDSNLNYSLDGGPWQTESFFTGLAPGEYIVTAQDESECTKEINFIIEEMEEIEFAFNTTDIDCSTEIVELSAQAVNFIGDESQITYLWSTGETTENITVNQAGIYELTIDDGCTISTQEWDIQFIERATVNSPAFVPNVFTANAIDDNSEFKPLIHRDIEVTSYNFEVFDRWGNKVFETKDRSQFWNGEFQDNKLNPGVFVWKLEMDYMLCEDPISFQKLGSITLLR